MTITWTSPLDASRARIIVENDSGWTVVAVEQGPGSLWHCVIDTKAGKWPFAKQVRFLSIPCESRHMAAVFAASEVEDLIGDTARAA